MSYSRELDAKKGCEESQKKNTVGFAQSRINFLISKTDVGDTIAPAV